MSADLEAELAQFLAGFTHDPLGYVLAAFPWKTPGTSLVDETGPRAWQSEILTELGADLEKGVDPGNALGTAIQKAVASGHGIGKSALVSWIILWGISTRENTRGIVTANTDTQLRTKTWPEVRKWHSLAINRHWFTCAATSIHAADAALEKTWRIDAIPWSENNTEAFAGLHNKGSRVLVIFDEASAIADKIWEVTEGALTDEGTEIIWCVFGNPTRNTGRFRECFGRLAHRWAHRQIDSRAVEGTNKEQLAKWVADYGEDSDFVRIRVRGVFPRAGTNQFIPSDLVAAAASPKRQARFVDSDPVILGVDVARFGQDESVIAIRKGRDARSFPWRRYRGLTVTQLAARVAETVRDVQRAGAAVDAIFVDEGGVGGGVIDVLRDLGQRCIGVNNGSAPDSDPDGVLVKNKAGEQWVRMRAWLGSTEDGGAIPYDDPDLCAQLESREYSYDDAQRIVLERKDAMAARGLSSPDRADALALTFAHHVGTANQRRYEMAERKPYDPLGRVRTIR